MILPTAPLCCPRPDNCIYGEFKSYCAVLIFLPPLLKSQMSVRQIKSWFTVFADFRDGSLRPADLKGTDSCSYNRIQIQILLTRPVLTSAGWYMFQGRHNSRAGKSLGWWIGECVVFVLFLCIYVWCAGHLCLWGSFPSSWGWWQAPAPPTHLYVGSGDLNYRAAQQMPCSFIEAPP